MAGGCKGKGSQIRQLREAWRGPQLCMEVYGSIRGLPVYAGTHRGAKAMRGHVTHQAMWVHTVMNEAPSFYCRRALTSMPA